jgi:hypothetical protein
MRGPQMTIRPVQVDVTIGGHVLGSHGEAERAGQIFPPLPGSDVIERDKLAGARAVAAQRRDDRDRASAQECALRCRAGMADLVDPAPAQPGRLGDLGVGQALCMQVLDDLAASSVTSCCASPSLPVAARSNSYGSVIRAIRS